MRGNARSSHPLFLTLISAIVEHIKGFHSLFSSLLVTKDQIDPLVEVAGDVFGFLEIDISPMSRQVQKNHRTDGLQNHQGFHMLPDEVFS